ncbi:MAG: ATP-binding protein, partial [Deltaproteobacteria bacterium]
FFGYEQQELLGKDVSILVPSRESTGRNLERLTDDILKEPEKYANSLNENITKDGQRVWVAWSNKALVDRDGRREVIAIGNDVTPMVRAENALRRREQEFQTLVENSTDIIARWNRELRFIYANPSSRSIRGNPPSWYVGKTIDELHLKDGEKLKSCILRAFRTDQIEREELVLDTPHGQMFLDQIIIPEFIDDKVTTVMGVARDITRLRIGQKTLEEDKQALERMVEERTRKLLKTEHDLDQASRLSDLGKLAATVAHELRNPLASIQLANFNMRRKSQDPRFQRQFETIDKKISESNQIIDDILFYSRIKPPSWKEVEIAPLLKECVDTARMKNKGCETRIHLDAESINGLRIQADPVQLKEIFNNLINNSCDAIKGITGREGKILVRAVRSASEVEIAVIDNGTGMSPDVLEKIRKPFFTTKSQGTGLGLTVAQQVVSLHNGSIDFQSEQDKGTAVTVRLPIVQ